MQKINLSLACGSSEQSCQQFPPLLHIEMLHSEFDPSFFKTILLIRKEKHKEIGLLFYLCLNKKKDLAKKHRTNILVL